MALGKTLHHHHSPCASGDSADSGVWWWNGWNGWNGWNVETLCVQGSVATSYWSHKMSQDLTGVVSYHSNIPCKVAENLHSVHLIPLSSHCHPIVIQLDYIRLSLILSAMNHGWTTGLPSLPSLLDGLADLLLGLGHHGLEAPPHGVLGVRVFAQRGVPRSVRSKTENIQKTRPQKV